MKKNKQNITGLFATSGQSDANCAPASMGKLAAGSRFILIVRTNYQYSLIILKK